MFLLLFWKHSACFLTNRILTDIVRGGEGIKPPDNKLRDINMIKSNKFAPFFFNYYLTLK